MHRWTVLLLAFGLAACHDSPRSNPLDPALTPPVELSAAADDTTGTVALSWTPYLGETAFHAYLVLRNATRSTEVETLFAALSPDSIRYLDRARQPDTAYEYRVAVVNQAGLTRESAAITVPSYTVQGVHLLAAEPDSLQGAVRLRWSRFVGPGFQAYQVIRKLVGHDQADTLAAIVSAIDTVLADAQAGHGLSYLYSVVTVASGQALASNVLEGRLWLPTVSLGLVELESVTATARLAWLPYRGPRFAAYRLERRMADEPWHSVEELAALDDTTWRDAGLLGNTEYHYRVTVLTIAGEEVYGPERRGCLHGYLGEWPLPLAAEDRVRLYWEDNRVMALLVQASGVRLLTFTGGGELVSEQELIYWPFTAITPTFTVGKHGWQPGSVCAARLPSGEHILSLVSRSTGKWLALAYGAEGQPDWREVELADGPPAPPPVEGEDRNGMWSFGSSNPYAYLVAATSLEVAVDGLPRMAGSDFVDPQRWSLLSGTYLFGARSLLLTGSLHGGIEFGSAQASLKAPWRSFDMRLQCIAGHADVTARIGIYGDPTVGSPENIIGLKLDVGSDSLSVTSSLADAGVAYHSSYPQPFPLQDGIPYCLRIAADSSGWTAAVAHPLRWWGSADPAAQWSGMVEHEGNLVLIAGDRPCLVSAEGGVQELPALPGPVSEVRSWFRGEVQAKNRRLGVCLPEQHRVLCGSSYSSATNSFRWPFASSGVSHLGGWPGEGPGELVYPISFAPGTQDRVYVLDAGNSRVSVFTSTGQYLTCWGQAGTGTGQFDFGQGNSPADLRGSIIVDDEGFIYVADPGNQRIQKFAP